MKNAREVIKGSKFDEEFIYFQEQDKKKLEALKAKAAKNMSAAYQEAHRNHCFRCGTPSLIEMNYAGIRIDMCINESCGAVHLDPGEMEKILEGERGLYSKIKRSLVAAMK